MVDTKVKSQTYAVQNFCLTAAFSKCKNVQAPNTGFQERTLRISHQNFRQLSKNSKLITSIVQNNMRSLSQFFVRFFFTASSKKHVIRTGKIPPTQSTYSISCPYLQTFIFKRGCIVQNDPNLVTLLSRKSVKK